MAVSLLIELALETTVGTNLPLNIWLPILAFATSAFIARYRRFWRRFGDHVLRGDFLLEMESSSST